MKKKDEEEKKLASLPAPAPAPTAQASAQLASPRPAGGGIFNKAKTAWTNFWQPSAEGVRVRDVVREIPGSAVKVADTVADWTYRPIVTRPTAQAILSVTDQAQLKPIAGENKGVVINTIPAPKDLAGRILFGKQDLKSYQQQTRDVQNWLEQKAGLSKEVAMPIGLAAGVVNAGLDLPGGSLAKKPVKEVAEKGAKEIVEKVAIKSVDDLAPYLKSLLPKFKGNLDEALEEASKVLDIPEKVVKDLRSGKVIEGDNFVFQLRKNTGDFVANFEKALKPKALPEIKQTMDVDKLSLTKGVDIETAKPVVEAATKAKDKVKDVVEEVAEATDEVVDQTKSFADDITGRKKFSELGDEAADALDEIANDPKFKELVERTKGAPVTADEVRQAALNIQDTLGKATSRKQTVEEIAKSTNSFDMADKLMTEGGDANLIAKYLNEGLSFLTDAARKLQSGNQTTRPDSIVGDPLIKEIYQRTGQITAEIVDAYKALDKTNPQAVREFYYTYAKPALMEVMDEYRYINILSSPETHKGNIRANLIDSVITEPGTKLMRGFVDRAKSAITKQPREHFSREATEFYKGFFSAGKEAVDNVKAVMKGDRFIGNPDLRAMPIGKYAQPTLEEAFKGIRLPGAKTAANLSARGLEVGTNINKALEAMDIFFTTLVKRGEEAAQAYRQSRGVELTKEFIEEESTRMAEEVALRTALDPTNKTGQGIVATVIDQIASWLGQNRNSPYPTISTMAKVIFPFLRTTANYLTRFVEYTPGLGMVNAIGRKNVDELIARQVFGSTILAGTLMYAFRAGAEDNLTWSAPTNEKEKTLFYDSGRRPFAIKLGDAWIPFQQLGMIGAPLALSAALKHHLDQEKTVSEPMIQSVAKAYGEMLTYFGNLSFARSFGNLGDALKGEKNAALKLINEPFRQVTPLAGFLGWAGAMIDTAYRTSTPINQYSPTGVVLTAFAPTLKNLPFLSFLYEPYKKTTGEISRINHPYLNALSPIKFSMENELFDFIYQRERLEGQLNKLKRDFEEGRINAGGVEQGVNNVLDNFVRFVGGDPSQMGDFTLPEQVERGLRIPKEEPTPINLTPEQEKQLAAAIPQIKKEMLEAITRTRAALANKSGRGVSVRASARKVSAPKLSGVGRGVALRASTPTRASSRGVALRSPFVTDTTSLGASMPELPRLG